MGAGENDVATNAHTSATGINNGAAVTSVSIHGTAQTVGPSGDLGSLAGLNVVQTSGEMNAALWDRFDDPTYYTA